MQFDPLKREILTILCWRCRRASVTQLSKAFRCGVAEVETVVRGLRSSGLTGCQRVPLARLELAEPLATWGPGDPMPEFGQVAWQLERRWRHAEQYPAQVVWATEEATRLVGGVAGSGRQLTHLQHDVGVAEVFVSRQRCTNPSSWLGEDAYCGFWRPAKNAKVPDAVIVNALREITCVIEFGGQYSRDRLEAFHRYWAGQLQTSYEIW